MDDHRFAGGHEDASNALAWALGQPGADLLGATGDGLAEYVLALVTGDGGIRRALVADRARGLRCGGGLRGRGQCRDADPAGRGRSGRW